MGRDHRTAVRYCSIICQGNVKGHKTLRKTTAYVRGKHGNWKVLLFDLNFEIYFQVFCSFSHIQGRHTYPSAQ